MAPLRRPKRGSDAPPEPLEELLDRGMRERMSSELLDVPAAVVCLVCGEADCPGCEERDLSRSGIVAVVAWERPLLPTWTRLWSTARSTTRDAETFFELLPDGPILPALRFAAICELLAVSAMLLCALPVAILAAPEWTKHLALDPHARTVALRVLGMGIPAFAALMVVGHAVHGLSIDVGAGRNGGRRARTRALRFGLYACGWDLVMGPLGVVVVALKEGATAAGGLVELATVHSRAARGFLRGCYRLEGERADKALAVATVGVTLVVAFAVVVVFATALVLALA